MDQSCTKLSSTQLLDRKVDVVKHLYEMPFLCEEEWTSVSMAHTLPVLGECTPTLTAAFGHKAYLIILNSWLHLLFQSHSGIISSCLAMCLMVGDMSTKINVKFKVVLFS